MIIPPLGQRANDPQHRGDIQKLPRRKNSAGASAGQLTVNVDGSAEGGRRVFGNQLIGRKSLALKSFNLIKIIGRLESLCRLFAVGRGRLLFQQRQHLLKIKSMYMSFCKLFHGFSPYDVMVS